MEKDSKKLGKKNGNICKFYVPGLCALAQQTAATCDMKKKYSPDPLDVHCRRRKANKNRLKKLGLPHDAVVCKAGVQGRWHGA